MWRIFKKKRGDTTVEIIAVDRGERTVYVRKMPTSQKALIVALCEFWRDNEIDWSITEVLRFEKPAHVFYRVNWLEGEYDEET